MMRPHKIVEFECMKIWIFVPVNTITHDAKESTWLRPRKEIFFFKSWSSSLLFVCVVPLPPLNDVLPPIIFYAHPYHCSWRRASFLWQSTLMNYECMLPALRDYRLYSKTTAMATSSEVVDSSEKAVKKTQNEAGPSILFAMYTYHANRYQNFTRIYCFTIDVNCFGPI